MLNDEEMIRTPLKRCLNIYHLTFHSIAVMSGAGIYVLTGTIIRKEAGAAACISYLLAGISASFAAMCYAEFATLIPRAGSVYVYTFLMLGELPAFLIGWTTVSDVIVVISSIAKAFSGTVDSLVGHAIYNWTLKNVGRLDTSHGVLSPTLDFVALALIIFMVAITAIGAKSSLTLNLILTVVQLSCLLIVSIGCYIYGSPDSWSSEHGGFAPFGFHGILQGTTVAVFAFGGFDVIANSSEETIDPKKTIPRAIMASFIIVCLFYFMASLGLALLVPREFIDFTSPFVSGFERINVYWLAYIAAAGTLLATGATKISSMYVVPRVLYSIASDGLIFKFFAIVERRTQVPLLSLFFGGSIAGLLALLINIQTLAEFTSLGYLLSYFTIGVDMMILRYIYDMPTDSLDKGHEAKLVDSDTESCSKLLPLRPMFEGVGERYSVIKTKWFFCMLLCIFIGMCLISSIVIDFVPLNSIQGIALISVALPSMLFSASTLFIYQPTINEEVYQVNN